MVRSALSLRWVALLACVLAGSAVARADVKYVNMVLTNNTDWANDLHILGIKGVDTSTLSFPDRPYSSVTENFVAGTNSDDGDGHVSFEWESTSYGPERVRVCLEWFDAGESPNCRGLFQWTYGGQAVGAPATLPSIDAVEVLSQGDTSPPAGGDAGGDAEAPGLVLWVVNCVSYTNLHVYADVPSDYWTSDPATRPALRELPVAMALSGTFTNGSNLLADLTGESEHDWYATFDVGELTIGFGDVVPEPATLTLLALGAAALIRPRRNA